MMIETGRRWFLPERMRFLPRSREMSIALRTLHLAAFGMLLGGHAFGVEEERLLASAYRHYSCLQRVWPRPGHPLGYPVLSPPPQGVAVAVIIDDGRTG